MPMTTSASRRNSRASGTPTYSAFGSALNIHSKWFCRANQVTSPVTATSTTMTPRRHHRRRALQGVGQLDPARRLRAERVDGEGGHEDDGDRGRRSDQEKGPEET